MNKLIGPSGAAEATRRVDFRRCAGALFLTLYGLLIAAYGYIIPAVAQSQPTAPPPPSTPASTPATMPGQKPGVNKGTATTVTGTIKGRVVSDDGRPLTNASVMAQPPLTRERQEQRAWIPKDGSFSMRCRPPST